jgi:hypothetical protein
LTKKHNLKLEVIGGGSFTSGEDTQVIGVKPYETSPGDALALRCFDEESNNGFLNGLEFPQRLRDHLQR